ncbi:hypothetical protein Scep_014964 [Stephania cephalantha]|uniref:Uncharacterized protein n=1 Tax=Stephania cephalantha TaxID=152367 RepID=A0AAP0J2C2_9MAGN
MYTTKHAKFTSKAKLYVIGFPLSRADIDEDGPGESKGQFGPWTTAGCHAAFAAKGRAPPSFVPFRALVGRGGGPSATTPLTFSLGPPHGAVAVASRPPSVQHRRRCYCSPPFSRGDGDVTAPLLRCRHPT